MSGYWCFHRSLLDWNNNLFMKGNYAKVICLILSEAAYKKKNYNGTELQVGEFVTSHELIAKRCNITKGAARYTLKRLEELHFLHSQTSFKGTVITVVNYERYQKGTQSTLDMPADRTQFTTTTNKKEKRIKNKEINTTDFFPDPELNKWVGHVTSGILKKWQRFDPNDLQKLAYEAKNWQAQHGKKYTSIASFLNRWFNRSDFYKDLEAEWELCQKYGY